MNYRITTSSYFNVTAKRLAKKYPSFKDDLTNFGKSLLENPLQGAELAPGIRKIRMAIKSKSKGKAGGARVITYNFITKEMDGEIVLLSSMTKRMLQRQRSMCSNKSLRKKATLSDDS